MTGFFRVVAPLQIIALVALAAAGCAKARASALPAGPPLETPLPPPRVVSSPLESEPIVTAVPPIEGPSPRTPPNAPRAASPRPERTEPPPATAASQVPPPPAARARAGGGTAPHAADDGERAPRAEQRIRGLLANATRDLGRIDYRVR